MSEFPYKNPLSPQTSDGPVSVQRTDEFGTNFSNLSVGGHMEVYSLSDLNFVIPSGTTGLVNYSGNTIPISLIKGTEEPFSFDVLTLYSDNISSGRRKLGMLVYVYENDQTYYYHINDYNTLWNNAFASSGVSGNTVVVSEFGTQIRGNSPAGNTFISSWTGSSIEGVSGVTIENANWRIFDKNTYVTGGTYFSATSTLELFNNDGSSVSVSGVGQNLVVSANTGLGISANTIFTTYNTLLSPDLSMNSSVGGFQSGTTVSQISGRTFVSLFDDLLFPTQLPTYTIPTISVNSPSSITIEIGSAYTQTIQIRAIKNDAGNFTLMGVNRNGSSISSTTVMTSASTTNVANQFGFTNPNSPNTAFTINYLENYTIPSGLTSSTTTYSGYGNYLNGLPKLNNKGVTDSRTPAVRTTTAPQLSANTFTSSNITITGIYPYYYGTFTGTLTTNIVRTLISGGTVQGGTVTKVLSNVTSGTSITYNASGVNFWFAHNASYPVKVQWYVDATNKGTIDTTTSGFFTAYSATTNSELSLWSGKMYYIYLSNFASALNSVSFNSVAI